MSLLILLLCEDRALLAVDTLTSDRLPDAPQNTWTESSKLAIVPHSQVAIAGRGDVSFPRSLATHLMRFPDADFDAIVARLATDLDTAFDLHCTVLGADMKAHPQDLVMAGYSQKAGHMAAVAVRRPAGAEGFESVQHLPAGVLGLPPCEPEGSFRNEDEYLRAKASAQVEWGRTECPGAAIGGRLLVADLRREALSVRMLTIPGKT